MENVKNMEKMEKMENIKKLIVISIDFTILKIMSRYVLKLKIIDESVRNLYTEAVEKMKTEQYLNNPHKDSGFDLYLPARNKTKSYSSVYYPDGTVNSFHYQIGHNKTELIDLGIQCAAYQYSDNCIRPQPFYIYPRSSIYKTHIRLANNTGIIDSGYRGNLKAAFDNIKGDIASIPPFTRLLQICMPNLDPFQIEIVDDLDETNRGEGGFGSTGK